MPLAGQNSTGRAADDFASTCWSVVLLAGREPSPAASAALEELCRAYWYPLYAFVRRQGHDAPAAQDLTQEFFSRLLATNGLEAVDRSKGRFRSFLLASMKNLLANEWNRARTQKRGGGQPHFSLDAVSAEDRYLLDRPDDLTPEKIFARRWAETVIDAVTRRLREEFTADGLADRFEVLKVFLLAGDEPPSYAAAAQRLDLSESATRAAIYRMRQRYGELFRAEIAKTVSGPEEMEEEIREYFAALGA